MVEYENALLELSVIELPTSDQQYCEVRLIASLLVWLTGQSRFKSELGFDLPRSLEVKTSNMVGILK